jgi:DegV family protein with EDD domain
MQRRYNKRLKKQREIMPKVAVLTDSIVGLPETILNNLNIQTVAYYIHRGHEVLRDLVTIQREEFIRWMMTTKYAPTTACPGPNDYLNAYEKLAAQGAEEIISIHMSSKISGAYQAATMAQSMLREMDPSLRLEVVDTNNASMCQGLMVMEAAHAALAGLSLGQVLAVVKKMIPISHMVQTADTLKYLYLGGRIGKAQNMLGSLLNIRPLIGVEDGEIVPLGRAHSRRQAYRQMADIVAGMIGKGKVRIAYVHAGAQEEVEKLKELVESKVDVVESLLTEFSPALAVHSGPGTTGLCYYPVDI